MRASSGSVQIYQVIPTHGVNPNSATKKGAAFTKPHPNTVTLQRLVLQARGVGHFQDHTLIKRL